MVPTTTTSTTTTSTTTTTNRAASTEATTPKLAAPDHNHATCPGCDQVLHIGDLAEILGESVYTLYKWSAIGSSVFPKRLHLRNGRVATTYRLVKTWMAEGAS